MRAHLDCVIDDQFNTTGVPKIRCQSDRTPLPAPSKFQGDDRRETIIARPINLTYSPSLPVEPSSRSKTNLDTEGKVEFLVEKEADPRLWRVHYLFVP